MALPAEIREQALERMGIRSSSQTTQSEIQASLDASYLEVYAQLLVKELVLWDDDEDVPAEFVPPLVALTAYGRIDHYSVPSARYQRIVRDAKGVPGDALNPGALAVIKELQSRPTYKQPTAVYY